MGGPDIDMGGPDMAPHTPHAGAPPPRRAGERPRVLQTVAKKRAGAPSAPEIL